MGITLILISALCFVSSSYFGKVVTNTTEMTAIVTSFSRFALGAIIMFIYILSTKKTFKPVNMKPIAFRAILNSISLILFSGALQYTTITNTNMLHMTFPVFVILFSPLITKEKIKKSTYLYLCTIMLGSYIVAAPKFSSINVGDILSLLSAIFGAFSIIQLSEARKYNEGYIIVFYVMLIGTFVNIPMAYKDLVTFDSNGLFLVLLTGLLGFIGQVFLTWGYKFVDSTTGSLVSTSRIIFGAVVGILFLSEPLNTRIVLGILLITLSLVGVSGYFNNRLNKLNHTHNEA